jgi:hypothetical protein
MKGWPKPKEVQRQAWLATNALALAERTPKGLGDILDRVRQKLHDGLAESAEDALLQLYQEYERPAPDSDGQLHLIIKDGALFAPGEESDE